jgi:hypothetical protein
MDVGPELAPRDVGVLVDLLHNYEMGFVVQLNPMLKKPNEVV